LLTRKRSQVQTLSRPPLFSQVTASSGPQPGSLTPSWAALGPHFIRTVDLVGPSRPFHPATKLHNDHGA
jgi:hypothetical protein